MTLLPSPLLIPALLLAAGASAFALPELSVDRAVQIEGNPGAPTASRISISFRLDENSDGAAVSVAYRLVPCTAQPGRDYTPRSGRIAFAQYATQAVVQVPLVVDRTGESSEEFTVEVSDPIGCTVAAGPFPQKIVDDDGAQILSMAPMAGVNTWTLSTLHSELMPGAASMTTTLATGLNFGTSAQTAQGDFDGDGIADVAYTGANGAGGFKVISGLNGSTVLVTGTAEAEGSTFVKFAVGDTDMDGKCELVELRGSGWVVGSQLPPFTLLVRSMPDLAVVRSRTIPALYGVDAEIQDLALVDLEGTGADIVLARGKGSGLPNAQSAWLHMMDGRSLADTALRAVELPTYVFTNGTPTGVTGAFAAPGTAVLQIWDWNGDGKPDVRLRAGYSYEGRLPPDYQMQTQYEQTFLTLAGQPVRWLGGDYAFMDGYYGSGAPSLAERGLKLSFDNQGQASLAALDGRTVATPAQLPGGIVSLGANHEQPVEIASITRQGNFLTLLNTGHAHSSYETEVSRDLGSWEYVPLAAGEGTVENLRRVLDVDSIDIGAPALFFRIKERRSELGLLRNPRFQDNMTRFHPVSGGPPFLTREDNPASIPGWQTTGIRCGLCGVASGSDAAGTFLAPNFGGGANVALTMDNAFFAYPGNSIQQTINVRAGRRYLVTYRTDSPRYVSTPSAPDWVITIPTFPPYTQQTGSSGQAVFTPVLSGPAVVRFAAPVTNHPEAAALLLFVQVSDITPP